MGRRSIALLLVFALLATSCTEPLRRGVTWLGGERPLAAPVLETDEAAPGAFVGMTHPSIEAEELAPVTVTIAGATVPLPVLADAAGGVRIPTPVLPEHEAGGRLVEVRVGDSEPALLRVGPLPPALDPTPGVVTHAVLGAIDTFLDHALLQLARIEDALEEALEGDVEGMRLLTDGDEEHPPVVEVLDALSTGIFDASWELLGSVEDLEAVVGGAGHPVLDTADLVLVDRLLSAWLVGAVGELQRTAESGEPTTPASHEGAGTASDDVRLEPASAVPAVGLPTAPHGRSPIASSAEEQVREAVQKLEHNLNLAAPLATMLTAGVGLIATIGGYVYGAAQFSLLVGYLTAVSSFLAIGLILGGCLAAVEGVLGGEGSGFGDVVAEATAELVADMAWLGIGEQGRVGELLATVRDLDDVRRAVRRVQELTGWQHEGHRAQYEADRERRERRFAIPLAVVHAPTRPHPRYGLAAFFPYGQNHPTPGRPTSQIVAGMTGALQVGVSGVHRWGTSVSVDWGCPSMARTRLEFHRSRSLFVSFTVPESCAGETLQLVVTASDDHRPPRSTHRTVALEVLHALELTPALVTTHPTTGEPVQLAVDVRNAVTRSRHPQPATLRATWSGDPPDVAPREVELRLTASDDSFELDHTFGRAGRYKVEVSVVDRFGQEAAAALDIEVRDPIEVVGLEGPQQLMVGETGAWTVRLQHGWEPVEVQVAFDDGLEPRTLDVGSHTFTHRFGQPRTHWISVDVTDAAGGRAHGAFPIEVKGEPVPQPGPTPGPTPAPAPVGPDGLVERSSFTVTGSIECTRDDGQPWGDRRSWQDYSDTGWFRPRDGTLNMDLRHGLAPGPRAPIAPFTLEVQPDGRFHRQSERGEIAGFLELDAAGNVLGGQGTHSYWARAMVGSLVRECTDNFTITPR